MPTQPLTPSHNDPLTAIVMDLIRNDQRSLAWQLIDHFFSKASTLYHFDVLGYLALKADKRDTYLKCAEATCCLAETPDQLFDSRLNLIKAYNVMNRPDDALFYIDTNLKIDPENFELHCLRAVNISLQGDKVTAEKILMDLQQKYPENAKSLEVALCGKYLREGQTAKGILSFIHSIKPRSHQFETNLKMQRWSGIVSPGKKLYVETEGGIGDMIINIRFFDHIESLGMIPILVSYDTDHYRDINRVLRRNGYQVITDDVMIDRSQPWISMMSIPGYLGLTESQLWRGTYLTPLRQQKNQLLGSKPRIGIKCTGNPYFAQDEYRKIPLNIMLDALPREAEIYYIDKDPQITIDHNVISLSDRIESWEDTLDFIDQMDCIVSSCTSLVHAAGAMGKKVFVVTPIAEYYVWTTTRVDGSTPWYGDNVYLAKQTKLRDWTGPLADIRARVHDFLRIPLG